LAIFLEAVVALALPIFLLYQFRSQAWYWHVLAVIVALVIGLMPGTALLETFGGQMLYGFAFVVLMLWGIGGLIPFRRLRKKQAQ
jgi:putative effector of murein hydrolase